MAHLEGFEWMQSAALPAKKDWHAAHATAF